MDKLRAAVARTTGRVARARPPWPLSAVLGPTPDTADRERGQGLAEYALILALIAIIAIASLVFLGGTISDMFWDPISEDFGEVLSKLGI